MPPRPPLPTDGVTTQHLSDMERQAFRYLKNAEKMITEPKEYDSAMVYILVNVAQLNEIMLDHAGGSATGINKEFAQAFDELTEMVIHFIDTGSEVGRGLVREIAFFDQLRTKGALTVEVLQKKQDTMAATIRSIQLNRGQKMLPREAWEYHVANPDVMVWTKASELAEEDANVKSEAAKKIADDKAEKEALERLKDDMEKYDGFGEDYTDARVGAKCGRCGGKVHVFH